MILSDYAIHTWAEAGGINPYDTAMVNPASIDMRLGNQISIPRWYWQNRLTRFVAWYILGRPDPRKHPHLYWQGPMTFERYTLWPGRFVLCHSMEATQIRSDMAALLVSKSSTGRIGLEHLHAGWGDPGFGDGEPSEWTWELKNLSPWPIDLIAGQPLMQLVLLRLVSNPKRQYAETGRYQGQTGPTVARVRTEYQGGKVAGQ